MDFEKFKLSEGFITHSVYFIQKLGNFFHFGITTVQLIFPSND